MKSLLHEELTYRIRAALWRVHHALGPGFREETYKRAVIIEFKKRNLEVETEKEIEIHYDGSIIDRFRLDLVIVGKVILELKAVESFAKIHESQLLTYLKASGIKVGLLVNFGEPTLQILRRVL
jgi:GxxExxY protein